LHSDQLVSFGCRSFYKKMGFHEIGRAEDDLWLGMRFVTPIFATPPAKMGGVIEGALL
jgi:hypothetical protein